MGTKELKKKYIRKNLKDWRPIIEMHIKEFKDRRDVALDLAGKGYMDSPYIPYMSSLGPCNGRYQITADASADNRKWYYTYNRYTGRFSKATTSSGGSLSEFSENVTYYEKIQGPGYVYKINVPGWIYRVGDNSGRFGIIVASSPSNLVASSSTRMLYMAGSENNNSDGNSVGNNMFPIYPGKNTYAYFPRDSSNDSSRELFFVPSRLSSCYGILPSDYAVPVGIPSSDISMTGDIKPGESACKEIFCENKTDWINNNFKIMFGAKVADESKMSFVNDQGKHEFVRSRIRWLNELQVSLDKYTTIGYGYSSYVMPTYEEYLNYLESIHYTV